MSEYRTGVYCWLNRANGKVYVGGAFVSLAGRLRNYRLGFARGKCHNRHLLFARNKYGAKAFVFRVLERCPADDVATREAYWIKKLRAADRRYGYNVCHFGANRAGVPHTEESCRKMSAAKKGKPSGREGTNHSEETKAKISESKRGVPLSAETKAKMSATRKGRKMSEAHRQAYIAAHWSRGPNAATIKAKIVVGLTGRPVSEATRAKISATKLAAR
jgi:group I intron endonuclease